MTLASDKITAEITKLKAETRNQVALARKHEHDLVVSKEHHDETQASDWEARVYRFTDYVDKDSIVACMETLATWHRLDPPDTDIEVVFTSPGGLVLTGISLFDFLRLLSREDKNVITTDLGYAASMSGILLQAGDVRRIGAESWLHIHEVAWKLDGKYSEHLDEVEWGRRWMDRMFTIFTERSKGKMTEKKLRDLVLRKEAWFNAEDCIKYGFADEIV